MGIFLSKNNGKKKEIHLNYTAWMKILKEAKGYGWEPAGTREPYFGHPDGMHSLYGEESPVNQQEIWDGNYESKDYQLVTKKDAEKMCEVLESARMDSKIEEKMGMQEAQFLKWKLGQIESFLTFCSKEEFRIG